MQAITLRRTTRGEAAILCPATRLFNYPSILRIWVKNMVSGRQLFAQAQNIHTPPKQYIRNFRALHSRQMGRINMALIITAPWPKILSLIHTHPRTLSTFTPGKGLVTVSQYSWAHHYVWGLIRSEEISEYSNTRNRQYQMQQTHTKTAHTTAVVRPIGTPLT